MIWAVSWIVCLNCFNWLVSFGCFILDCLGLICTAFMLILSMVRTNSTLVSYSTYHRQRSKGQIPPKPPRHLPIVDDPEHKHYEAD